MNCDADFHIFQVEMGIVLYPVIFMTICDTDLHIVQFEMDIE